MMKFKSPGLLLLALLLFSCQPKSGKVEETRTSGTLKLLVDASFSGLIDEQIEVFRTDYPNTEITQIKGEEGKIVPAFLNDSIRVIVMSRALNAEELKYYQSRKIPVNADRFAIDGLALITGKNTLDSNITVKEVIDILQGRSTGKSLVFDSPYSSALSYLKKLANINELPKTGVFTLQSNNDVLKYVAEHDNYVGVVGLYWLLKNAGMSADMDKIMLMNVKNLSGQRGDDAYYKPTQKNIMNGIYPLRRDVYIVNAEGRDGLGTGFATWLTSARGQLIVLKSGLAPDVLNRRDINLKSTN